MADLTQGEFGRKLDELLDGQQATNKHLATLNGKVARHDEWIAIRSDRESRAQQEGTRAITARQFYVAQIIAFAVLIVAILAVILGAHGVS